MLREEKHNKYWTTEGSIKKPNEYNRKTIRKRVKSRQKPLLQLKTEDHLRRHSFPRKIRSGDSCF